MHRRGVGDSAVKGIAAMRAEDSFHSIACDVLQNIIVKRLFVQYHPHSPLLIRIVRTQANHSRAFIHAQGG